MFSIFKKKSKSEYAQAVEYFVQQSGFKITPEGMRTVAAHEATDKHNPLFTGAFVFMNGICNQLCDVSEKSDPMLGSIETMQLTSLSSEVLQVVFEDGKRENLLSEKEMDILLRLQTELVTGPDHAFQHMLSLGRLAKSI